MEEKKVLTKQEKMKMVKGTKGMWANDENIEKAFEMLKREWKDWKISKR